jgi:hypothetical protein
MPLMTTFAAPAFVGANSMAGDSFPPGPVMISCPVMIVGSELAALKFEALPICETAMLNPTPGPRRQ